MKINTVNTQNSHARTSPLWALSVGLCLLTGMLTACAPAATKEAATRYADDFIAEDTIWSGHVVIDGTVKVAKNATLTILPGTDIGFVRRDADEDGLGDGVLAVEGRLIALGTSEEPIRFHSAAPSPQPGDWLEIRVDFSKEVHLRYCDIRDSAYTLHAHFTRGIVEDSRIHRNIDGSRLGQATFTFRNNIIEHNQGKGINFRNSSVSVHHNIIRYNGSGIFLFESDRDFDINHNNFHDNLDNFRLGDFYTGHVSLQDNWWGTPDVQAARTTIYDRSQDPGIGSVSIEPAAAWIPGTGPRKTLTLEPSWQFATEGYVDADMAVGDHRLFAVSWDHHLYALDGDGQRLWSRDLGDVIDAAPAISDERLFLQTWRRAVYALEQQSGDIAWRFDYSPSRADDHRQGVLHVAEDKVFVPAWNGRIYALSTRSGQKLWDFEAGQPLRAAPVSDGEQLYVPSGDGTLSVLDFDGTLLWQQRFDTALLSSPALLPQGIAVVSRNGLVMAFDSNGQTLWQQNLDEPCYYGRPVYHEGSLFLATAGGSLWKLDARTGYRIWRADLAGPSYATPLIHQSQIYIGDNSGTLQVVGADSGTEMARIVLDREIQGQPLFWNGLLIFGSRDQKVHAFKVRDSEVP